MKRGKITGINRVYKKMANGKVVQMHYAWRGKGAPCFWRSDSGIPIYSKKYYEAFSGCSFPDRSEGKFRSVIDAFIKSQEFCNLAPKTQATMRYSLLRAHNSIDSKFGDAPLSAFEDPRIRKQLLDWRDQIGGKVGDDRARHLQRIVSFAVDRAILRVHHLRNIKSTYKPNRSEILWTEDEISLFVQRAPEHVARILIAATETGLRPGDLFLLSRQHIQATPLGRRIVIRTSKGKKRKRIAAIPLTPRMAKLIDDLPPEQERIITNKAGRPYKKDDSLGDAVCDWRDKLGLRKELRLYDARGTAATRLINAGADMKEMALHMGWSLKHAGEVIEYYVSLDPTMSDTLADKLRRKSDQ